MRLLIDTTCIFLNTQVRYEQVHTACEEEIGDAIGSRCLERTQLHDVPVYLLIRDGPELKFRYRVVNLWVIWVVSLEFGGKGHPQ